MNNSTTHSTKHDQPAKPAAKKRKGKFDSEALVALIVASRKPMTVEQIATKAEIPVTGTLKTRLRWLAERNGKLARIEPSETGQPVTYTKPTKPTKPTA